MIRGRDKLEVPVAGRISANKFRTLETWCNGTYRKRSEVVSLVLDRVLEILEQQHAVKQASVEQFVQRLRVDPPG